MPPPHVFLTLTRTSRPPSHPYHLFPRYPRSCPPATPQYAPNSPESPPNRPPITSPIALQSPPQSPSQSPTNRPPIAPQSPTNHPPIAPQSPTNHPPITPPTTGAPTEEDLAWATALCCLYIRIKVIDPSQPPHLPVPAFSSPPTLNPPTHPTTLYQGERRPRAHLLHGARRR